MTCHHYHNMKYYRKQINLSCVYWVCSFAFKNHVSYHVSFKFMLECFTESSVIIIVPLKKMYLPGPGRSSSPGAPPDHRLVVDTNAELDM